MASLVNSKLSGFSGVNFVAPDFADSAVKQPLPVKIYNFDNNKPSSFKFFVNFNFNKKEADFPHNQLFLDLNMRNDLYKATNFFTSQSKQYRVLND